LKISNKTKGTIMEDDFKWKCIICEQNVKVIFDGNMEKGYFPNIEGGNISIKFEYGSKHDMFLLQSTGDLKYQMCICDNCFDKKKHLSRLIRVIRKTKWKEIKND